MMLRALVLRWAAEETSEGVGRSAAVRGQPQNDLALGQFRHVAAHRTLGGHFRFDTDVVSALLGGTDVPGAHEVPAPADTSTTAAPAAEARPR